MDLKLEKVFTLFLRKNFYFVDEKEAKLQLESHPDFPSLRAVTDTLDYLDIEHLAIQVPKEALDELPDCFLAIIDTKGEQDNSLIAAEKKGGNMVMHNVSDKQTVAKKAFQEVWDGIVVAVEPNLAEKGSGGAMKGVFSLKTVSLAVLAIALVAIFVSQTPGLMSILYLVSGLAGLAVSVLILREEFGEGSRLVDRICNATQATSCQEVLSSKGAKLFGDYGLSDMGLVYFVTVSLTVLLGLSDFNLFFALNILSVPVLLYTWYYQAFKVKKWCVLCLILSAMVLVQLTLGFFGYTDFAAIELATVLNFGVVLLAAVFGWLYVKDLIRAVKSNAQAQGNLLKFKKDRRVFQTLLQQGKSVKAPYMEGDMNLLMGNPKAPVQLIAVTNPMCGFCKAAFEAYDKILSKHGDKVAISLKFNVFIIDSQNPGYLIANRMVEVYQEKGGEQLRAALRDWFGERDVEKWFASWGKPEKEEEKTVLENHKSWSQHNDINYTPATVLGGFVYPREYELVDLIYFIEELTEPAPAEESAQPVG